MIFHLQHCFDLIFLKCLMYTASLQWTRGHQCVCLAHTAHLTDLPYTLCTNWELPPVQWNKQPKKKKNLSHTNTDVHWLVSFCSTAWCSWGPRQGKKKVQKAEWEMLIRGMRDSETQLISQGHVLPGAQWSPNDLKGEWSFFAALFQSNDLDWSLDELGGLNLTKLK